MSELQKFVAKLFNKNNKDNKDLNLPTKWNINDKSDSLSVSSDGLKVEYTGRDC